MVDKAKDRIIRKLRKEIVRLETEIGGLCERVQRLESELTLLREAKDVD